MDNSQVSLKCLNLPDDLNKLSLQQCEILCRDIRKTILKNVMKNGGHLASNLGTVELTVAMHRVFHSPYDKFVWDVGHQAYTHKLLTGRYDVFNTLRQENGISGFIRPSESKHDTFISGHSSTSISAALAMAEAMKLNGDMTHKAIAVIGDGAFTGGLAYEGLNNAGKSNDNIIVILNHNDMSISKNVGALAKYLTSIRGNEKYLDTKKKVEKLLNNTPVLGEPLKNILVSSKSLLKTVIYHSTMFEDLGFVYLGPVDGHNLAELEETLKTAKRINKPVFIHVNTIKGKGYKPAEKNPGEFHSISAYKSAAQGNCGINTFSDNFGIKLAELAEKDKNICAISAAMKYGTGLQYFAAKFHERFYDVGIAEQHAVTFSGGLAKSGKIPVFAVYSSFIQRSYDQIIHDAAIDDLHIVLAIDRAGIVGEDGETHQGIFDIPMLTGIPNTTIYAPSNFIEQDMCLEKALYNTDGVAAIRYPRGNEYGHIINDFVTDSYHLMNNNSDYLAIGFGRTVNNLYEALNANKSNYFDILKLVKIYPIDSDITNICRKYSKIIIFEESSESNGIGEHIVSALVKTGYKGDIKIIAINGFVPQSTTESGLKKFGLDIKSMAETTNKFFYLEK